MASNNLEKLQNRKIKFLNKKVLIIHKEKDNNKNIHLDFKENMKKMKDITESIISTYKSMLSVRYSSDIFIEPNISKKDNIINIETNKEMNDLIQSLNIERIKNKKNELEIKNLRKEKVKLLCEVESLKQKLKINGYVDSY